MNARLWVSALLGGLLAMTGATASGADSPSAPGAAAPVLARFDQGRLWLATREAPPPLVFSTIARETGVRFAIDETLELSAVTFAIEGKDLERAIRDLISKLPTVAGHAMVYAPSVGAEPRLVEVAIFGAGGPRSPVTIYHGEEEALSEAEREPRSRNQKSQESETAAFAREERSRQSSQSPGAPVDARLPETEAEIALRKVQNKLTVLDKLSKIPGGLRALDEIQAYVRRQQSDAKSPTVCAGELGIVRRDMEPPREPEPIKESGDPPGSTD